MAQLIGHYISGKHIVETQRSGPIFNPSTGEEIAQCAYGDVITVNQAVQASSIEALTSPLHYKLSYRLSDNNSQE